MHYVLVFCFPTYSINLTGRSSSTAVVIVVVTRERSDVGRERYRELATWVNLAKQDIG